MMVKQTRIAFDSTDILDFTLLCNKCGGEVSASLGKMASLTECPICEATWGVRTHEFSAGKLLLALSEVLHDKNAPATLRFEIDGEDDRKP